MAHVGLSLMIEEGFRGAVMPLFEQGLVEVLEWSFEIGWASGEPPWVSMLLDHFAEAGRLFGHGVTYSPLSTDASLRQGAWLQRVGKACRRRHYQGVSEHFGFMGNDALDLGAPLPMPNLPETIATGRAALRRLKDATRTPVGLENLALAFSERDVRDHGALLDAMLEPEDGYLVLDVHNLDCQVRNFGADADDLLDAYPLGRVRCIHVSGGSWSEHAGGRFRRDTHDDDVPDSALDLLARALPRCPNAEAVFLERLGPTVYTREAGAQLRRDFAAIRKIVGRA